jgi:hypothetical protein
MRTQIPELCPCGTHLTLSDELPAAALPYRYSLHCDRCYDGTDDSVGRATCLGHGATPEDAYTDWWEQACDAWDIVQMGWGLVTLERDVWLQIVDERERVKGWSKRPMLMPPNPIVHAAGTSRILLFAPEVAL